MKDQGFEHAHSSPIKTPTQLVVVTVLAFVIPVVGLILLAQFVISGYRAAQTAADPDTVARRIQPVARVEFADAAPAGGARAAKSGEEVYKAVCATCHGTGVAGAWKFGDKAAWSPHLKEGLETLAKNAINGIRAMPPRGGNPDLSDLEVTRAVVYMGNAAGANFKEPAAPAAKPAAAAAPAAAPAAAAAPATVAAAPAAVASAAPAPGAAADDKGKAIYNQACVACHATGVANAPKFGDKAAWAPRIQTGMDALYATSLKGKGAMPPKGGNTALADADVKAAVDYMVAAAK
jgi:cytochrome c5